MTKILERRLVHAFRTGRILPSLLVTMLAMVFIFAAVMRIVDRTDFPTYGLALWWAVSTVTTVGYGDVVPVQPGGRLVASILMLFGFAFLSLITGTIASALVTRYGAAASQSREILEGIQRLEGRIAQLEQQSEPR